MEVEMAIEVLVELGHKRSEVMDLLDKCGGNLKEALKLLPSLGFDAVMSEYSSENIETVDGFPSKRQKDQGTKGQGSKGEATKKETPAKKKMTALKIILPNGETLVRSFQPSVTLQSVRETLLKHPEVEPEFVMTTLQTLDANISLMTLEDLGLSPSATLIVTNKVAPSNNCFETTSEAAATTTADAPSDVIDPLTAAAREREWEEMKITRDKERKKHFYIMQQEREKEKAYRAEILRRIEADKKERKVKFQYV